MYALVTTEESSQLKTQVEQVMQEKQAYLLISNDIQSTSLPFLTLSRSGFPSYARDRQLLQWPLQAAFCSSETERSEQPSVIFAETLIC